MRLIDADALKIGIISQSNTGRESYSTELICEFIDEQQTVIDWIPADNPPKVNENGISHGILISFSNCSDYIAIGWYEQDEDGGGVYYLADTCETCISKGLFVNAWMPLPEPYKEEYVNCFKKEFEARIFIKAKIKAYNKLEVRDFITDLISGSNKFEVLDERIHIYEEQGE